MQRGTTIDLNNFLEIESGNYQIGVHKNTIEAAFKKIANSGIKKEFLYHSFPEHIVATKRFRISQFLTTISQSEGYGRSYDESFEKAWKMLAEKNPIPASCGRVCPHPCESGCNRKEKDGSVGINNIERFLGD